MSSYIYDWYSKLGGWRTVTRVSDDNQKRKTEKREFREMIKERDELREQVKEINERLWSLRQKIFEECPHKVKYHEVEPSGREDDYGSYQPGKDYTLKCNRCEESIAKWGQSGSFFGRNPKTGKTEYGCALEYYRVRVGGVKEYKWRDAKLD